MTDSWSNVWFREWSPGREWGTPWLLILGCGPFFFLNKSFLLTKTTTTTNNKDTKNWSLGANSDSSLLSLEGHFKDLRWFPTAVFSFYACLSSVQFLVPGWCLEVFLTVCSFSLPDRSLEPCYLSSLSLFLYPSALFSYLLCFPLLHSHPPIASICIVRQKGVSRRFRDGISAECAVLKIFLPGEERHRAYEYRFSNNWGGGNSYLQSQGISLVSDSDGDPGWWWN